MCPQKNVSGRGAYRSETQNPYQIWLARKVEGAVEKALHYERQQILEEYVVSRKWVLPQNCEERRLVTTKIHSLLLQWRPDFSAEWSLKLRRSLPIVETIFAHMASSREDFSNPLLIEPRLKGVLSFLDSNSHKQSPRPWPIFQSSTHHRFAHYLYCFHHPCHHLCTADQAEGQGRACACLQVDEERSHQNGQYACSCGPHLDADKERRDAKVHEAHSLDEKRLSDKTHKAISCLGESCLYWEESFDTKAQKSLVFGSCLDVKDELEEGILHDSLQWSGVDLPSRGTVASLMASELRSSRKEEANQALWNALASEEVALLKDNLHKHGEFASKWMVSKIMATLKRSKKKKHHKTKKVCAENLLHYAAEQRNCCAESPSLKVRSLSKGLLSFFSCHTTASEEWGFPADQKPLPADLEVSDLNHPCCLVCMRSEQVGDYAEKDDAIQAEVPISCSSSMISFNASSIESSTDADNDNANDTGSCDSITNSLHWQPINKTLASLIAYSARINISEELTCSSSKDLDEMHSGLLSGNVSTCHQNVEVGMTTRVSPIPSNGSSDVQVDLVQSSVNDSDGFISANQVIEIESADDDLGLTDKYDPKRASMVSCNHRGDSESHGSSLAISHDDNNNDANRPLACGSFTKDPLQGKETEGIEACTCVKGRDDSPLKGEHIYAHRMQPRSTSSLFSHMNSDDQNQDLAKAKMQTSSVRKDGKRQEEGAGTSCSYVLEDIEDETQVVAEAPIHELRATQSKDKERQGQGGANSGCQRERTPLGSFLAEREDWSVQNTMSWFAWGGSNCSWDTWEEPDEALDPFCCVCMMGLKGAAFTPCGHTFCRKCSRELWQGRGTCPLCNKLITGILDIF